MLLLLRHRRTLPAQPRRIVVAAVAIASRQAAATVSARLAEANITARQAAATLKG